MYADYAYYSTVYGGTVIPAAEYTKYANRATAYMDKVTFGRITTPTLEVKTCSCEVAEFYYNNGTEGTTKTAESVGGYSASYTSKLASYADRLRGICLLWLPSEMMYRGAG